MREFFSRLTDEQLEILLKIVLVVVGVAAFFIIFGVIRRKIKRAYSELKKDIKMVKEKEIDTVKIDTLSSSNIRLHFDKKLKHGEYGVFMTADALSSENNDIKLPRSKRGRLIYFLCIHNPTTQTNRDRRFYIAKQIEPELDELLRQNSDCIKFEK